MHFHGNHVWTVRGTARLPEGRAGRVDADGHVVLQQWEDVVELERAGAQGDRPAAPAASGRHRRGVGRPHGGLALPHALPRRALADRRRRASTPAGSWPTGCWPATEQPRRAAAPRRTASQVDVLLRPAARGGRSGHRVPAAARRTFLRDFFNRRLRFPDGAEHEIWSFESLTLGPTLSRPADPGHRGRDRPRAAQAVARGPHDPPARHGAGPAQRRRRSHLVRGDRQLHLPVATRARCSAGRRQRRGRRHRTSTTATSTPCCTSQMGMVGRAGHRPRGPSGPPGPRRAHDGPSSTVRCTTSPPRRCSSPTRWTRGGTQLNHAAGLSGRTSGLNRFEPKHFYVLGGRPRRPTPRAPTWLSPSTAPGQRRPATAAPPCCGS